MVDKAKQAAIELIGSSREEISKTIEAYINWFPYSMHRKPLDKPILLRYFFDRVFGKSVVPTPEIFALLRLEISQIAYSDYECYVVCYQKGYELDFDGSVGVGRFFEFLEFYPVDERRLYHE